jgi:hypothetical protein
MGMSDLFDPPTIATTMDQRRIATLRTLGRLEFLPTGYLWKLLFPTTTRRWVQLALVAMEREGLIWRTSVPHYTLSQQTGQTAPPRNPDIWGLTTDGWRLLEQLEAEPDRRSLEGLRHRDPRGRPASLLTLKHDLQASWWCASLLYEVQRSVFVRSVFVQVEYVSHERQRIDAMVVLRLSPDRRTVEPGVIPWFEGDYCRENEREVRLALEIDRGTEPLKTLLEKGVVYRDLTAQGVYSRNLGGPVLPVFVVPTMVRARQIANEWQYAWPDGWGVIAPLNQAGHPQHGVLWGTYRTMRKGEKAAVVPLLTYLALDPQGQVTFQPVMTLEQWRVGLEPEWIQVKRKERKNANDAQGGPV